MDMRGLSVFISEIRKCATKEEEQKKVDKELAKIRSKFKSPSLKGYERKKYVCKLLYIYMLGYEIDFGHIEAVNLLSSEKFSEKHTGYLACTVLLHENHELVTLITNSIKRDLNSKNGDEQCLALTAIANIGGKEQAETLHQDVAKLLVGESRQLVRKKAALTLLTMYRKYPELFPHEQWAPRLSPFIGEKSRDLGVITSVLSLVTSMISFEAESFADIVPRVVTLLTKLIVQREFSSNYLYYGIAAPWLQVKLFRILQYYEPPVADSNMMRQIAEAIKRTQQTAERIKADRQNKSVSRVNAAHSVLFEAFNVIVHYDHDEQLLNTSATLLGKYMQDKDPNLKYLSLDTMSRMAFSKFASVKAAIRKNLDTILLALKDPDISIRRRALDLLYSMCDTDNASHIVGELLAYLPLSNYEIREELVLKIAILAERFAEDLTWYVDVILNLITQSGDFVSEEIWYRVVQLVTNNDENLQNYTASTVLKAVSSPSAHENLVKISGYILGEFGEFIVGEADSGPQKQFDLLHSKFDLVSVATKALLLNTYLKFFNNYHDEVMRNKIRAVFDSYRNFIDSDMQQRANEYFNLAGMDNEKLLGTIAQPMPVFPERESSLMKKILERQSQKHSRAVKVEKQQEKPEEIEHEPQATVEIPAEQPQREDNIIDFLGDDGPLQQPPQAQAYNDPLSMFTGASQQPQTIVQAPVPKPVNVAPQGILEFDFEPAQPQVQPNMAQEVADIAAQKSATRAQQGVSVETMMAANKLDDDDQLRKAQLEHEKYYSTLLVADEGVAIEDSHLQVHIKNEFHGQKGRMLISYGNKTINPINKVRTTLTKNIPQLDIQFSQIAPLITPEAQVSQMLNINCLQPFSDVAVLSVFFEVDKKTFRFDVKLPIAIHKFIEPLEIADSKTFFFRWNAIQKGEPLEKQEIFKPQSGSVNVDSVRSLLSSGFHLNILGNVDPNSNNIVAAGTFNSEQAQQVVLVRIETNPQHQAYRLTTRTTNNVVSQAIFQSLKQQISAQ